MKLGHSDVTNAHRVMHNRCCASPMRDCTANIVQSAPCTILPRRPSHRSSQRVGTTQYACSAAVHAIACSNLHTRVKKCESLFARCVREQRGQHKLHAHSSAVGSISSVAGKLFQLRNHNDTGRRTAQALPKEALVTGQIRRQENYNYTERRVIIYPLYIEEGKQGTKTHKQSPRPRGTHTGYTT